MDKRTREKSRPSSSRFWSSSRRSFGRLLYNGSVMERCGLIVDDRVGRMDGYTVVAYAGVVEEEGGTGLRIPMSPYGRSEGDAVDPQSEQGSASSSASGSDDGFRRIVRPWSLDG